MSVKLGRLEDVLNEIKISDDYRDLMFQKNGNDLLIKYGVDDRITVTSWFREDAHQIENIYDSNETMILNTQINQLIEEMAVLTAETGMSWENLKEHNNSDYNELLNQIWVKNS